MPLVVASVWRSSGCKPKIDHSECFVQAFGQAAGRARIYFQKFIMQLEKCVLERPPLRSVDRRLAYGT